MWKCGLLGNMRYDYVWSCVLIDIASCSATLGPKWLQNGKVSSCTTLTTNLSPVCICIGSGLSRVGSCVWAVRRPLETSSKPPWRSAVAIFACGGSELRGPRAVGPPIVLLRTFFFAFPHPCLSVHEQLNTPASSLC